MQTAHNGRTSSPRDLSILASQLHEDAAATSDAAAAGGGGGTNAPNAPNAPNASPSTPLFTVPTMTEGRGYATRDTDEGRDVGNGMSLQRRRRRSRRISALIVKQIFEAMNVRVPVDAPASSSSFSSSSYSSSSSSSPSSPSAAAAGTKSTTKKDQYRKRSHTEA